MTTWYAAHIIMFVELKEGQQDHFPVWENIILVEASSEDEAFDKAEDHGHQGEGDDDGSFRWGDKPARWVFAGVRKLTECAVLADRPGDGTEIASNELEVGSRASIDRLVDGEAVDVRYNDRFRPAPDVLIVNGRSAASDAG